MPPRRCRIRARIVRKLYQLAHHRKPPAFVTWRNDRTRIWTFLLNTTARFVRFRFALFQRLPSSPVRFRFFSQQGLIYLHGYPSPAAECLRESCRTKKSIIHCRPTHGYISQPPYRPRWGGVAWFSYIPPARTCFRMRTRAGCTQRTFPTATRDTESIAEKGFAAR